MLAQKKKKKNRPRYDYCIEKRFNEKTEEDFFTIGI